MDAAHAIQSLIVIVLVALAIVHAWRQLLPAAVRLDWWQRGMRRIAGVSLRAGASVRGPLGHTFEGAGQVAQRAAENAARRAAQAAQAGRGGGCSTCDACGGCGSLPAESGTARGEARNMRG